MKILYIVRLFSGLEESLETGHWRPTGAPTSYKLIEVLDRSDHKPQFVFTVKDGQSRWQEAKDREVSINGLRNTVTVLAGERSFPDWLGGWRGHLRDMRHSWHIWRMVRREKPDVIYIGHANIWVAGFLARFQRIPVIFRVMGVYPVMREALKGRRPAFHLLRWAYRAPYAAVIVSQDGSGVESWLDEALAPDTPRHSLVNGVEISQRPDSPDSRFLALPSGRTIVLFLGRMDAAKGCGEFLKAFLTAWRADPEKLHALIVGTGPMADTMLAQAEQAGASKSVTFIPRLPHDQVSEAHARSDIYVSLNRLGNLSNANLEAMKAGQCIIFPKAQKTEGIDVATDKLIPPEAVTRIASADAVDELSDAILRLHTNPNLRAAQSTAMREAAGFIPNWEDRINTEIAILCRLCDGEEPNTRISDNLSSAKP